MKDLRASIELVPCNGCGQRVPAIERCKTMEEQRICAHALNPVPRYDSDAVMAARNEIVRRTGECRIGLYVLAKALQAAEDRRTATQPKPEKQFVVCEGVAEPFMDGSPIFELDGSTEDDTWSFRVYRDEGGFYIETTGDPVLTAEQIAAVAAAVSPPSVWCQVEKKLVREACNCTCKESLGCGPSPSKAASALANDLKDVVDWLGTLHALHPKPTHLEVNLARFAVQQAADHLSEAQRSKIP